MRLAERLMRATRRPQDTDDVTAATVHARRATDRVAMPDSLHDVGAANGPESALPSRPDTTQAPDGQPCPCSPAGMPSDIEQGGGQYRHESPSTAILSPTAEGQPSSGADTIGDTGFPLPTPTTATRRPSAPPSTLRRTVDDATARAITAPPPPVASEVSAATTAQAEQPLRAARSPRGTEQDVDVSTLTLHGEHYYEIKGHLLDRLLELLDLAAVESLPPDRLGEEIGRLVDRLMRDEFRQAPLNASERRQITGDIRDEILGLGPLEPLLRDPTVNDILINNYRQVYVERRGKLIKVNTRFQNDDHLRKIIDRIVSRIGRRVDESSPMVDARLADGSRVNAIIPPLALDGASLSIRRFSKDPLELHDLIGFGALTPEMGEVLQGIVKARMNIIVSGGTGSGKTTMLNCLSRFVPHDERIVTIEDAAELQLKQEHVVRLETRPANIEGHGEVTARDLVKNCLRMRPDRIIVGEVRSGEVLDMLQAMNTGHDGSLTTIHANTPRDCLMRLETMVAMAGLNISTLSLKRYISSAVDVIIQVSRLSDGSRKLTSLMEITGMEGEAITMQEIYSYEQTGVDDKGKVQGHFRSGGIRPNFAPRLAAMGIHLGGSLFDV